MAYGDQGQRASRISDLVASSGTYRLRPTDAQEIVDHQVEVIHRDWNDLGDLARLSTVDRERLWGRQILHDYAFP
jgi:serine/threonine-protein kinase HipA